MSASLYPKPDGLSTALQHNGVDSIVFNQGGAPDPIYTISCTQGTGALTFTLNPCVINFRSTTLTSGTVNTRVLGAAATLVLPSGGTLGAVTTVSARVVVVAIDNAGTVELACVNVAGGNDLSETGVINTTAIDTGSDSANVFYSTTARTGVAYKVVGIVDAVNTAGAWGNPTLVQGAGGQAVTAMSSLGYGQTWQTVTGSRAAGITYYNTTGKPIEVSISGASVASYVLVINGINAIYFTMVSSSIMSATGIVPVGGSYSVITSGAFNAWAELR